MCNKEDKEMETAIKNGSMSYHANRKKNIEKAMKQVKMIQSGKLPKKTARDFLRESRNK